MCVCVYVFVALEHWAVCIVNVCTFSCACGNPCGVVSICVHVCVCVPVCLCEAERVEMNGSL